MASSQDRGKKALELQLLEKVSCNSGFRIPTEKFIPL